MSVRKSKTKLFSVKGVHMPTLPTISMPQSFLPKVDVAYMTPTMNIVPAIKKMNKQMQHTTAQVLLPLTIMTRPILGRHTSDQKLCASPSRKIENEPSASEQEGDESVCSESSTQQQFEEEEVPRDPLLQVIEDLIEQESVFQEDVLRKEFYHFFHERYDEYIIAQNQNFGLEENLEAYTIILGHVFRLHELPSGVIEIALNEVDDYIFPRLDMACHDLSKMAPGQISKILSWLTTYRDGRSALFPNFKLPAKRQKWLGRLANAYLEEGVHKQVKAMVRNRLLLFDEDEVVENEDGTLCTRLVYDLATILETQLAVGQEVLPPSMLPDVLIGCNQELFELVDGLMFHLDTHWKTMDVERICAVVNDAQLITDLCDNLNATTLADVPDEKMESSEALLAELSQLALHATRYLCERIFLDMKDHLDKIGTQEWEEGDAVITTVIATLYDYFEDLQKWVPAAYFFPKILKVCLDLTLRYYVDAFFGNTMAKGLNNVPKAIQKVQLDCMELWNFFGIDHRSYHGRAGFYSRENVCHRIHLLEAIASLLECKDKSPMLQDSVLAIIKQFGVEAGSVATFHLFGLQGRRISAKEAQTWHETVAIACEHASMQRGTGKPMYILPDLRNSPYVQRMRKSRQRATDQVDLAKTNQLVRRKYVPRLGLLQLVGQFRR